MGGFMLFDDNGPVRTLGPKELQSLALNGEIDFPWITENEIRDKSKGDVLSKGLVVIQTGWFILQCIARGIEHLPLTELELVTLAFAALNFVTYGLWWNKPLNVQCPIRIAMKRRNGESEGGKGASKSSQSTDDETSGPREDKERGTDAVAAIGDAMWGTINIAIVRKTPEAMGKATGAIVHAIRDAIKRSVEYVREHRWWTFWNGVGAVLKYGILVPLISFGEMGFWGDEDVKVGTMFYAGDDSGITWPCAIAGGVIATIFGAIHCVAWSFQFPSHTEQTLWRIASLSITCSPMVVGFAPPVIALVDELDGTLENVLEWWLVVGSSILYILSRVTLLVIALMSLRSLPPGAYETVHWTIFIPHV
jgi:hypothetical protein